MKKIGLIIGYGSIGKKHAEILKKRKDVLNIYILTDQNLNTNGKIKKISNMTNINPDYIVIANSTSLHLNTVKLIEKNFEDKIVLVEKPLFQKYERINVRRNSFFVGYNLRLHPIIKKLKELIKNEEINFVDIRCESYLPIWRKNISYIKSSSAIFIDDSSPKL